MANNRKVFRKERKYLLNPQLRGKCEGQIREFIEEDKHNGINGYMVRSLYFDTLDDRDINEKRDGIESRRKIRLRTYSPDAEFVFLELKQKQGANQLKRSLKVNRKDAEELVKGQYDSLLGYDDDFAAECYSLLTMHTYRPKVIVEYNRKAFVRPENDIRITFDQQIVATPFTNSFFDPKPRYMPVLTPAVSVLEVKYNHFLLSYIKEILEMCGKNEIAVSKYVLAREQRVRF